MGTIFLSVFEIVRLNIVPIKACGSILIDYSHPALPYSHLFQICNPSAINCSHNFHTSHLHYQYLQESCKLNIGLFGPIFSDLYKQSLPLQFFNISELNILTLSFSDTVAVPVDYINFFILISVILKSQDVLFDTSSITIQIFHTSCFIFYNSFSDTQEFFMLLMCHFWM